MAFLEQALKGKFIKSLAFQNIKMWESLKDKVFDYDGTIIFKIDEMSKEALDIVVNSVPKANIQINKEDFLFNQQNVDKLMEMRDYLKEKYDKELDFHFMQKAFDNKEDELWSIDKVVNANSKLQTWADKINNATIDGRKLSQFEKYLFAYQIVTRYEYKEEDNRKEAHISRNILGVLNSDRIVCVGYAELLSKLCEMVGVKCYSQGVACNGIREDHATCCVNIEDDLYNIHGIYYSDPCWDSKKEDVESTLQHSLLSFDELDKGFVEYPLSVHSESLQHFNSNDGKVYSRDDLCTIALKVLSDEELNRFKYEIIKVRESLDVGFIGKADDVHSNCLKDIKDVLGVYGCYYKIPLENIISRDSINEKFKKILEQYTNEEIIETLSILETFNQAGFNVDEKFVLGNSKVNLSNLKKIKHPTHVTKENYLDALINVNMALGCTYEQAESMALQKWNTSIEELDGWQKVDDGFSTAFIEEAKTIEHGV